MSGAHNMAIKLWPWCMAMFTTMGNNEFFGPFGGGRAWPLSAKNLAGPFIVANSAVHSFCASHLVHCTKN